MDDAFDLVRRDHALDEVFVRRIADEQRYAIRQEGRKSGRQIVDHHDAFVGFRQRLNHVTSDIAGAAGDKHGHDLTQSPRTRSGDAIGWAVKSGFRREPTGHYA
jgi:hypothetical protein